MSWTVCTFLKSFKSCLLTCSYGSADPGSFGVESKELGQEDEDFLDVM